MPSLGEAAAPHRRRCPPPNTSLFGVKVYACASLSHPWFHYDFGLGLGLSDLIHSLLMHVWPVASTICACPEQIFGGLEYLCVALNYLYVALNYLYVA